MAKTVRRYFICQPIISSAQLQGVSDESDFDGAYRGMNWHSCSTTQPSGDISTNANLRLTPETGPEIETVKVTVTLLNYSGEKFVETFSAQTSRGMYVKMNHNENMVRKGQEEVLLSMSYEIEVTGVFPKVVKPKTWDFESLDPVLTDVILIAEGQKFHVNKAILITHSSYFKELLAIGNGEYELENITSKVLQELLQVIYHTPEIYDDNIEELLKAAKNLDVPLVSRKCREYLEGAVCRIVDEEKEEIVEKYELETLPAGFPKDFTTRTSLDDMILKVGDQRFFVNRKILAVHSPYFKSMLFEEFRRSKIELRNIKPDDLKDLLDIIYHCPVNNANHLLKLAKKYNIPAVTAECNTFLAWSNGPFSRNLSPSDFAPSPASRMIRTVRKFSVDHALISTDDLQFAGDATEVSRENMGIKWYSTSSTHPCGSILTRFELRLTPETGPELKTIKVTVTFQNDDRKKFVETFSAETSRELRVNFGHNEYMVGDGPELILSMRYDIEVTGVFPKVLKPKTWDFEALNPVLNDVILVAEGQKLHVNKAILTTHSPYFKELLATGNGEYELENITPKVLQEFLQVLYHVPEIYEDNIEELLEAAIEFDVPLVSRNCYEYLEGDSCCIVDEDKEELVMEYNLDLQAQVQRIPKDFGIKGPLDDMILKVEAREFHINRRILATHSSYFYTMFFGGFQESGRSEIELKDIDPVTFQQLLEVLYHFSNIHENNVENLLELARIYDAQPVTSKCQKFIKGENGLSMEEKQRLTEEYFPK